MSVFCLHDKSLLSQSSIFTKSIENKYCHLVKLDIIFSHDIYCDMDVIPVVATNMAENVIPLQDTNKDNEETESEEESVVDEFPDEIVEEVFVPDEGEELILPWLSTGTYQWDEWLNDQLFPELSEGYDFGENPTDISPNMITLGKKIALADVRNRMDYAGVTGAQETQQQFRAYFDILSAYKKNFQNTCDIIVSQLMLHAARKLHFADDEHGNGVRDWDEFLLAVEDVSTRDETKQVTIIVYLIFDFLKRYKKIICEYVLKIHNVRFNSRSPPNRTGRKAGNFITKMVTHSLNALRKSINTKSSDYVGFKYTITRYGDELENAAHKHDNRKQKYFYDWMVQYNAVSTQSSSDLVKFAMLYIKINASFTNGFHSLLNHKSVQTGMDL